MTALDTLTKAEATRLTTSQVAGVLDERQLAALADVDAGLVHSERPNRAAAVKVVDVQDTAWDVTATVQRLERAYLVERVRNGTKWILTPAGTLILKRHAGGAR